jgi:hypothetical protein
MVRSRLRRVCWRRHLVLRILFHSCYWIVVSRLKKTAICVAMTARSQMNDYRFIYNLDETPFTPPDSIALHKNFASKFLNWLGKDLSGPRVIISRNAPVINPNSKYKGGPLTSAFECLAMIEIIGTHQPSLWVYGHTHKCDDQTIGRTRIILFLRRHLGICVEILA